MSKCDLKVVLDDDRRAYAVGETITGHVEVSVNANCTCNGLTLTQRWRTHGRGNTARGPGLSETLFTGDWYPGEVHTYPFRLTAPEGPLTYHGHYLNVDHYLEARADIPWALDPKAETEVLLELGQADPRDLNQLTVPIHTGQLGGRGPMFCMALFLAPFIVLGVGAFLVGVVMAITLRPEGLFMMLWGSIFGGAPGAILLFAMRNTFAQRKLGPVELHLEPNQAGPGDKVRCTLSFKPRGDLEINGINATFKGEEVVISGSGTNATTHRHPIHSEEHPITGPCRVRRLEDAMFQVDLIVPDDAPWSFSASSNRLSWACEVHIDIPRWPDWKQEVPLVVLPSASS